MSPIIVYSSKAIANLRTISDYLINNVGPTVGQNIYDGLITEIEYLADTPTIAGFPVKGISLRYRSWITAKRNYRIYYKRLDTNAIKVLLVVSTRQNLPSAQEVLEADQ